MHDIRIIAFERKLNKIIKFNHETNECQMTKMKKEVQLKKAKKKSESTRINLLTLRSWTQDQDNTIEKRRKKNA